MNAISNMAKVLGWVVIFHLCLQVADGMMFQFWRFGANETDNATIRSGLGLWTDYGTGCQYVGTRNGGLAARLDASGRHICRPATALETLK